MSAPSSIERLADDPRVTVHRSGAPDPDGRCVVYWMRRAQRAAGNPALETAVRAANVLQRPLVVFFRLTPGVPRANLRHYQFLIEGLREIGPALQRRRIGFVLRCHPHHQLQRFCVQVRPCLVVTDDNPLREAENSQRAAAARVHVPWWSVDADVIVPSRLLRKEQYAARTIRPRIQARVQEFLVPPGNSAARVPWTAPKGMETEVPTAALLERFPIDRGVAPVSTFRGGTAAARRALARFIDEHLDGYAVQRNHPECDGTSQLSPYLHFGHIGPHTVALAVRDATAPRRDRDAFLEELIVRRELAVNFVRYNARYDELDSVEPWAERTLSAHAGDRRAALYSERQLEQAETHDPLWNAAQMQMVTGGWMHNYLRMYWAKKILEWSRSPAAAYRVAVTLNDRYELDGRDPNGYAGIAWAIGGKHDRAWGPERPVYGTVRYMSYASTSRKFDSKAYIARVERLVAGRD